MSVVTNVGDVFKVRLNFRHNNNVGYNILHYRLIGASLTLGGGGLFPGELTSEVAGPLAEAIFNKVAGPWSALAALTCYLEGASASNVDPLPNSRTYNFVALPAAEGTVVSDPLPLQDAPTLLKRSELGTRWGLGRIFIFGLPESAQSGGRIDGNAALQLITLATAFGELAQVEVGDYTLTFQPVLFARLPNNTTRITPINEVSLSDLILKTQRRRRPGKGI